eukprot:TRINITY_DN47158_c0_g1_i1.p1 TRINITY_DN47158_c0_g1~~TRINITY_DN47158_c0_g1_i1.p1  ORF type:complete len:308 (-),score=57.40 TRINITY_DN47158_c0_g1_i1:61-984(-)
MAKLSATASLLPNNLASSSSGMIAALHSSANLSGSKVVMNVGGASKDGPEVVQGTSVRYLNTAQGPVLCVCSNMGTRLFNEDASTLLFHVPVSGPDQVDVVKHHRGSCFVPSLNHIVVGTHSGGLLAINVENLSSIAAFNEIVPVDGATDVVDICYCPAANTVVTAHDSGQLRSWSPAPDGQYVNQLVAPPAAEAPVAVASLGNRLAVAYIAGHIRLFDAVSMVIQAEITAHARCLNAMDVREDIGQIATVGEDTFLNVFLVDAATGQVQTQHSAHVVPKLLTGVVLTQSGALVSAYDSDELIVVNF